MGDHRTDFQTLIATARSGDLYARRDAVFELVQYGREAEAPLVALLADPPVSGDGYHIKCALDKVGISYSSSVDTVVGLLNLRKYRWYATDLLLHHSPNIRRHLPVIRAVLDHETDPGLRAALQKLLDRYPKFSAKSPPPSTNQAEKNH